MGQTKYWRLIPGMKTRSTRKRSRLARAISTRLKR
jgi:hypothetical protein